MEVDPARLAETAVDARARRADRGDAAAAERRAVRRRRHHPLPRPHADPFSPSSAAIHFPTADGSFVIERVAPGRVAVAATTRDGGIGGMGSGAMKEVEVREGETTRVDLVWRDILLAGKVTRGGRTAAERAADGR